MWNNGADNRLLIHALKSAHESEVGARSSSTSYTRSSVPRGTRCLARSFAIRSTPWRERIVRRNRLGAGKNDGFFVECYGMISELDEAINYYGSLPDADDGDVPVALADIADRAGAARAMSV